MGLLVDCGGVFELSEDKPTMTIASPNYPDPYNPSQRCQWTIRVTEVVSITCDECYLYLHVTMYSLFTESERYQNKAYI